MTTQTIVKRLDKEMSAMRQDLEVVKSVLLAAYQDPEGEYKDEFVKKILVRSNENPKHKFVDKTTFLKHVYGGKKRN